MKAKDLNKIRYVIYLRHTAQPDIDYYYAGQWPDVELARLCKEGYRVSVFDETYYTTDLALARVFDSPVRVQKISKQLKEAVWADYPTWDNVKALPIVGEEVFKAKLKGPSKIEHPTQLLRRIRKISQQFFNENAKEEFEELE